MTMPVVLLPASFCCLVLDLEKYAVRFSNNPPWSGPQFSGNVNRFRRGDLFIRCHTYSDTTTA